MKLKALASSVIETARCQNMTASEKMAWESETGSKGHLLSVDYGSLIASLRPRPGWTAFQSSLLSTRVSASIVLIQVMQKPMRLRVAHIMHKLDSGIIMSGKSRHWTTQATSPNKATHVL